MLINLKYMNQLRSQFFFQHGCLYFKPRACLLYIHEPSLLTYLRGIEWCLRASASSVFIFASTSSWQIFLASSEHFRNYRWRAASTLEKYRWRAASTSSTSSYFVNFPLAGISLLLIGNIALRQVIVNNRAETSKSGYHVLYSGRNIDFTLRNQYPTRPLF